MPVNKITCTEIDMERSTVILKGKKVKVILELHIEKFAG